MEKCAWEDTRQPQMDTGLFNFDIWEDTGHGLDISTAESPALLAMLLMEVNALAQIASLIGEETAAGKYQSLVKELSQRVQQCWDDRLAPSSIETSNQVYPPTGSCSTRVGSRGN